MDVQIIRTDGSEEKKSVPGSTVTQSIAELLGARALDTVRLREGRVMMVDDTGFLDKKPVNAKATALYHAVCRPGTIHPICGDVAILLDTDFD